MRIVHDTTRELPGKRRGRVYGTPGVGCRTGPGAEIREQVFGLAVRIVRLAQAMARDVGSQVVARQAVCAGAEVGANVAEARAAASNRECARRMNIGRAGAVAVRYRLDLPIAVEMLPESRVERLRNEAGEMVRILSTVSGKDDRPMGSARPCGQLRRSKGFCILHSELSCPWQKHDKS